jgi:membrane-associated protein
LDFGINEYIRSVAESLGWVAHLIIFGIVFAESGLLVGFFLPGDSLLLSAGFLAKQGYLNPALLFVGCFVAAVVGDQVGYVFGARVGRKLFERDDSMFFHRKNLLRTEAFYQKHGGKTIVLARFLPVIRTFAPIVAGVGTMKYRNFVFYNVAGGFLWTASMIGLGYLIGDIPGADKYIIPIVLALFIIPGLPTVWHLWQEHRHEIFRLVRQRFSRATD